MPWTRSQRASQSPCMPKIRPRGPTLTRIGPRDHGRKPPLTCGDAVEPPIGIEPMTYSLRVKAKPSIKVRRGRGPAWQWAKRCGVVRSNPGCGCLLYTSDAADDLTRVDLGGRRLIKK